MVYQEWSAFKTNIMNKAALRFLESELFYTLKYGDFDTSIMKDSGSEQTDFETNYKSFANKTTTEQISPFDAKTDGVNKLFARSTGQTFALSAGANTCDFSITYTKCKITGIELIGGEHGDYVDFYVAHPTYGVLGQFAYTNYIAKDFYVRESKYDADLVAGLILRCIYHSITAKPIYVNYLLHEVA